MERTEAGNLVGPCHLATTWCASPYSKGVVRQGSASYLGFKVCRSSPALERGPLRFPDQQEAEVVVSQGGRELWRWSDTGAIGRTGHSLEVADGTCLRWRTTWNGTTSEGRPLPPGTYDVTVYLTAALSSPVVATTTTRIA